jgi:peptidoglycan hydrolase CwlO-like protein
VDFSSLMTYAGFLVAVATIIVTVQKILKNVRKSRDEDSAKILQAAKEEISSARSKLEGRIKALEGDLDNLKESMSRDLEHVKETHQSELENVSGKIQEIRQELRDQHIQIIQLLTSLIDSR